MAHSIRGRQGCRPLRSGWLMVRTGGGTHRCRPTNTTDCPAWFGGRVRRPWGLRPGGSARCGGRFGTGISRRARCGCFAGCGQQVFRPLRRATGGAAPWTRDLGNAPPVGKRCRQGILRQSKVQLCSHTGCMARSCTAAMAQKARRHPQTHRWQVATQKKIE